MQTFFVEIKCKLGKTYDVASRLADAEIASEIYSIAGHFDILAKFHIDDNADIGHFVGQQVQTIADIVDTHTIITFKAFCTGLNRQDIVFPLIGISRFAKF